MRVCKINCASALSEYRQEYIWRRRNWSPEPRSSNSIKENDLKIIEDVQNVLKDLFAEALQEMLEAELDATLGYEKTDAHNKRNGNRRNGHSPKAVRSEFVEINIQVPRDREKHINLNKVNHHYSRLYLAY